MTKVVRRETHIGDVSLTFQHGTLNILLGPTLSGKTSLMRLMAGLDVPTAGSGLVRRRRRDRCAGAASARSRWSTSSSSTTPNLTVYENIASPLRVAGAAGRPTRPKRVSERRR